MSKIRRDKLLAKDMPKTAELPAFVKQKKLDYPV